MKMIHPIIKTTSAICLSLGILAAPAMAEKTIKLSILHQSDPYSNAQGAMASVFKSLVESGSNGELKVKIYSDGMLGKDNEVIQQNRDGIIQANVATSGGLAQHYPLMGIFDVPFLYPNIAVAQDVITLKSDFGKLLAKDIDDKIGLKVLGMIEAEGFYVITNNKHPITSVADMKGLRIRTMTVPTQQKVISSLGGKPTPLPWAEVYTSLQTGVVDGQMNPIPIVVHAKFDEVQKYLTLTQHLLTPYMLLMNDKFYKQLTDDERRIVDYAARSAVYAGKGIGRINEASDKGLTKLAKKMKINSLSPEAISEFASKSQPAIREMIKDKYGDEGMKLLKALTDEIQKNK